MKINTKKLKSFYATENSEEIKAFVTICVEHFLEGGSIPDNGGMRMINPAKVQFLKDFGLITE
jgi:hypothetical protein